MADAGTRAELPQLAGRDVDVDAKGEVLPEAAVDQQQLARRDEEDSWAGRGLAPADEEYDEEAADEDDDHPTERER